MRFLQTSIAAALVGFGTVAASPAWAVSNSIESIIGAQQGSTTQVRIRMGMPLTEVPASFSLANPHRLALDFKDTDNRIGRSLVELTGGDVKSVNVVQGGERARVVLNMTRPMRFKSEIEGNDLILSLDRQESVEATPAARGSQLPMVAQASKADARGAVGHAHSLKDIDFRRGKDGEGRVVINLSDDGAGVDVRQQGKSLIVEFQGTRLPDNLRRQLDVADFGTPVKTIRSVQQNGNARLIIEPQGLWEHSAYQSDSQFVVEVKPVKEDPNRLTQGSRPGYRGERLSLNFQNVDVRALLQVIADFTNLNIVTSDTVQGKLTLRLKDVPWDQALDIIMQSRGLDMRKNGNVVMIAPREELATKEKLALESKQQISEIEPLRTETFTLNYQTAEKLREMLTDEKQSVLSKRGSALADIRSNKLFVMDTPSRLDEVRQMIAQIDIPVRQVLIEARIVEADDRFSRNLGTKLGYYDRRSTIYRTAARTNPVTGETESVNVPVHGPGSSLGNRIGYGTISGNLSGAADLSSQLGGENGTGEVLGLGKATALDNTNFFSFPAGGINGTNPASLAISLFGSSLSRFINLELSALEADQRGKVVSSPRVLTSSQRPAVIEQGTELPYQSATSSGATSVSFRKANLRLEVTPQITPEGNVILDVDVSRDAVGQLTNAGYAIDTRHVKTQVEDGGTVVIGGIYEQFERNRTDKVPLLGDIPVLGYLFRSTTRTNDRTELLVFLTPRIVTDTLAQR